MKRLGLALLLGGAVLFLVASSRRGGYDSFEGSMRVTFSKSERGKRDFWGSARTLGIVVGVAGVVVLVMSGRKN